MIVGRDVSIITLTTRRGRLWERAAPGGNLIVATVADMEEGL